MPYPHEPAAIAPTAAVLEGAVAAGDDGPVDYWFEYGPTTAYGSSTARRSLELDAQTPRTVSEPIAGLNRSSEYHHRLCVQDADQSKPLCAPDTVFRTQRFGCGETVTQSFTLTGTLDCRSSGTDGLEVGANAVTIDLAGHEILGGGTRRGIDATGFDGLRIVSPLPSGPAPVSAYGVIAGWGEALHFEDADDAVIGRFVRLEGVTGVSVTRGTGVELDSVDITGEDVGVRVEDATNFHLMFSQVHAGNSGALLRGNVGVLSGVLVEPTGAGSGGVGVEMAGNGNRSESSLSRGWALGSFAVLSGDGNYVSDSAARNGVLAGTDTSGPRGDGLFVGPLATGTYLFNVKAEQNAGDGIEIQNADTELYGSGAWMNGDWGIDAVPGVTTDDNLFAGGNGQPAQCRNVVCRITE